MAPTAAPTLGRHVATTPAGRPALLVTHDTHLAETLSALTAPDHSLLVIGPDALPDAAWHRCPLLLVGADAAAETIDRFGASLGGCRPVLVSPDPDPTPEVWRAALALRAPHVVCLPDATEWIRTRLRTASRNTTLVLTVIDACGGHHGTTLAAALATVSCAAGRDTLLAGTNRHHAALPGLLDALPSPRPGTPGGELLLIDHPPDTPEVNPEEIHSVLDAALAGDTVIFDAPPAHNPTAHTAAGLADLTLVVLGPHPHPEQASAAATDTLTALIPHAYRLAVVLTDPTVGDTILTRVTDAGWTASLPTHTCTIDPTSGEPDTTALLDIAQALLRDHLAAAPPPNRTQTLPR